MANVKRNRPFRIGVFLAMLIGLIVGSLAALPTGVNAEGTYIVEPMGAMDEALGVRSFLVSPQSAYGVGAVIGIRFRLYDEMGALVTDAQPSLTIVEVTIDSAGKESGNLVPRIWVFAFDAETQEYALNLDTTGLKPGVTDLWIAFHDDTQQCVRVTLN